MRKIKIAVISDIHGNSEALKAAILDAQKNNVDEYIFPGDLVNDLPFGNETLEIIKNTSNYIIEGNKEEYLKEYNKSQYTWPNLQINNVKFMYKELTKENLDFIFKLPVNLNLEFEGVKIKVVHGSPKSIEEQIHKVDEDLINKYANSLEEDVLIFAHSHEQVWYRNINGKLLVNVGCAGVSPYYLTKAEYVILHINNKKVEVEKRLVPYDLLTVKNKIKKCGILEYDKVLMSLTYAALAGNGKIRHQFFVEAKEEMEKRNHNLYKPDAKGIYKYFKLYDDDIWLSLYNKYKQYFEF